MHFQRRLSTVRLAARIHVRALGRIDPRSGRDGAALCRKPLGGRRLGNRNHRGGAGACVGVDVDVACGWRQRRRRQPLRIHAGSQEDWQPLRRNDAALTRASLGRSREVRAWVGRDRVDGAGGCVAGTHAALPAEEAWSGAQGGTQCAGRMRGKVTRRVPKTGRVQSVCVEEHLKR